MQRTPASIAAGSLALIAVLWSPHAAWAFEASQATTANTNKPK